MLGGIRRNGGHWCLRYLEWRGESVAFPSTKLFFWMRANLVLPGFVEKLPNAFSSTVKVSTKADEDHAFSSLRCACGAAKRGR
jgi:hypothetical protein